jgi:hypothetical protein
MLRIPRTRNPPAGNFGVAIRHHRVSGLNSLWCNGSTQLGRGLGPRPLIASHMGGYSASRVCLRPCTVDGGLGGAVAFLG